MIILWISVIPRKNSINNTVADVFIQLQDNYGKLITHELLERKEIIKNMTYHPREAIATVFSVVKELFEFSDITRTLYTQQQAIKFTYVIIYSTSKFWLSIHERANGTTCQPKRRYGLVSRIFFAWSIANYRRQNISM